MHSTGSKAAAASAMMQRIDQASAVPASREPSSTRWRRMDFPHPVYLIEASGCHGQAEPGQFADPIPGLCPRIGEAFTCSIPDTPNNFHQATYIGSAAVAY